MNKIINKRLNIIEIIALSIACLCVCISLNLYIYNITLSIFKYLLLIIGLLSEIVIVSIELSLFIILNPKYKYIYLGFLLVDLLLFLVLTKLLPFGGIISILPLCTLKFVYRITNEKEIYNEKEFKRYCRMFKIKLPKQKKKSVVKKVTRKNNAQPTRKTQKSYA